MEKLINDMSAFSNNLSKEKDEENAFLQAIDFMEQDELLGKKMAYYLYLRQAVNTSDGETANEINLFEKQTSRLTKPLAVIKSLSPV